jgi:hypothetical protein
MVCSRCEVCVHGLATGGITAMLCCSEDEEFFDEDFYACEPPDFCIWYFVPLCRSLVPVISFVLRYVVINTGYIVYFTICHFVCEN